MPRPVDGVAHHHHGGATAGDSWNDPQHSAAYLARADGLPHRQEGEAALVDDLSEVLPGRLLDLGCGDGRLTALLLDAYPGRAAVCLDLSPVMLAAAEERFGADAAVALVRHDFARPLPLVGAFDAVVSSLAVHHVDDARKRALFAEVAGLLRPGGVFANLEVVASPTPALHARWRLETGAPDDPSDRLRDVESQLRWLADCGFDDVDCIWKWRGLALLRGCRR